jgi:hypothetical protein
MLFFWVFKMLKTQHQGRDELFGQITGPARAHPPEC